MKQIYASILLLVFTGFLVSISLDFSLYLQILNAGASVEDVSSMPEEHNEKSGSDSKLKNHLALWTWLLEVHASSERQFVARQKFSLAATIYFDVPYSPPELG